MEDLKILLKLSRVVSFERARKRFITSIFIRQRVVIRLWILEKYSYVQEISLISPTRHTPAVARRGAASGSLIHEFLIARRGVKSPHPRQPSSFLLKILYLFFSSFLPAPSPSSLLFSFFSFSSWKSLMILTKACGLEVRVQKRVFSVEWDVI